MMFLASGAMLALAAAYLILALVRGQFQDAEDPAEHELDGVRERENTR